MCVCVCVCLCYYGNISSHSSRKFRSVVQLAKYRLYIIMQVNIENFENLEEMFPRC